MRKLKDILLVAGIASLAVLLVAAAASGQTVEVPTADELQRVVAEQSLVNDAVDSRLDALEGVEPPIKPPIAQETDLGIGVNFYRYRKGVVPDGAGGYAIDDEYARLLGKWSCVRYLDWSSLLNKERNWTWANRVTDADFDRWDKVGLPLEAIIAFANATKTHIWWTAPIQADEEYMRRAGRMFATELNPALHVYLEIGNEVWASNRGWLYHDLAKQKFPSEDDKHKRFGEAMRLYAQDIKMKGRAFIDGGFPRERLTRIAAGQLHNFGVLNSHVLKHLDSDDIEAITVSGYFGNSPDTWRDGLESTIRHIRLHGQLARDKALRFMTYEFESHINIGTSNTSLHHSPEVIEAKRRVLGVLKEEGAYPIMVFNAAGNSYASSPWANYSKELDPSPTVEAMGWPQKD